MLGSLSLVSRLYNPLANTTNSQYLPEPFLWDTFYHLVEAVVTMKVGPGDWDFEIVHRDIKPANSKPFHIRIQMSA